MSDFRSHFPIFSTHPRLVYLDSAATTQKPEEVIEAVSSFYRTSYANIHRGLYDLSLESSAQYEAARTKTARFIGATSPKEIIFTRGATESLNLLATTLGSTLKEGDEIIVSDSEHHSNLVPWQELAKQRKVKLLFTETKITGELNLEHFQELLSPHTRIVSLTHCSNVFGVINPLPQIKKILNEEGSQALVIIDASQSIPHITIDVRNLGCDFLVFSSHKMYGPSGVGILWGRESLLSTLPPYQTGGDMVRTVSFEEATWNDLPWKFEAGTPNIEGVIGFSAALDYLEKIKMGTLATHISTLFNFLYPQLMAIPEVTILGQPNSESGLISFTVKDIHPHDLAELLGKQQVCIRAGHHCAAPLHHKLDLVASNRVSFGLYSTNTDSECFLAALKEIIEDIRRV